MSKRLMTISIFLLLGSLAAVTPAFGFLGSMVLAQEMTSVQETPPEDGEGESDAGLPQLRTAYLAGIKALKSGDALEASRILLALRPKYPVLGDYILYYEIQAANTLEDFDQALLLTDLFLSSYGQSVLTDMVQFERIKVLLARKDLPAFKEGATALMTRRISDQLRRRTDLLVGAAHEAEAQWKRARDLYQKLAYEDPVTDEGREAERRLNHILHERETVPPVPSDRLYLSKVEALHRAFQFDAVITTCNAFEKAYPESPLTEKGLVIKAHALIKTGQRDGAIAVYKKLIRSAQSEQIQAKAAYRLGSYYWNRQNHDGAKKYFKQVIKKYPRTEWRLHANYALGRILEAEGHGKKAEEQYLQVGKANPSHTLAAQSAWRAGWVAYQEGRYETAMAHFDSCMKQYEASNTFQDALYWKGRAAEKLKRIDEAREIFLRLSREFGWDFYGVMARGKLEAQGEQEGLVAAGEAADTLWKPVPIQSVPGSAAAFHLDRVRELTALEQFDEAGREVDALASLRSWSPEEKLYIGTLYEQSRQYYRAVRMRARLDLVSDGDGADYLRRALYPLAYWETVSERTNGHGVDPFLVLSVMRQESLFQADVVSPADARGLMQIIPPTGKMIASRLGVNGFSPNHLFDPKINIDFGVWYLKNLMDRSDGDLVRVLSSYNAGESRSDLWWERTKHLDMDERIESITFRETRNYVKRVLRNLENYKRLYAHLLVADSGTGERP